MNASLLRFFFLLLAGFSWTDAAAPLALATAQATAPGHAQLSWSTEEVPAQGKQEVFFKVSASSAWQLSAESASGTSCVLVGRVRGPMKSAGSPGQRNCLLNVVLEEGDYRLLLESPPKGQGKVRLMAKPFVEVNERPLFLPPGASTSVKLSPLQQATFWFEVKEAKAPSIRLVGKTLWHAVLRKNGQWWLGQNPSRDLRHPSGSRELFWAENLEPGVYALQAWGLASDSTEATVDETLSVSHEHFTLSREGFLKWEMPASGVLSLGFVEGIQTAWLRMDKPADTRLRVQLYSAQLEGNLLRRLEEQRSCTLEGKLEGKACVVHPWQQQATSMLELRGEPGTTGTVEWLPNAEWMEAREDRALERRTDRAHFFSLQKGLYMLWTEDFPPDEDGLSLSCMLEKTDERNAGNVERLAFAGLELGPEEKFQQRFNYNGHAATLWFRWLAKEGEESKLHIAVGGERETRCSLYAMGQDGSQTMQHNTQGKPFACGDKLSLPPGLYALQLNGGHPGIEFLSMEGEKSLPETPSKLSKVSCLFPNVSLPEGRYRLSANKGTQLFRLFSWEKLPVDSQRPLRFVLNGKESVKLPLKTPQGLALYSPSGQPFTCTFHGQSIAASEGECLLPAEASGPLHVENPGDKPLSFVLQPRLAKAAPVHIQHVQPALPVLTELKLKTPHFFSFERQQFHSALVKVSKPGLYRLETTGLLSTQCELWTPLSGKANAVSAQGRGRNCLLYGYLEKGSYLAKVTVQGSSQGRAGLLLSEYPSVSAAAAHVSENVFSSVGAGHLVHQKVEVPEAGEYTLESFVEGGAALSCRLEDAKGWPLEASWGCHRKLELEAGEYVWTQFPLEMDSSRRTRLSRVVSESVLSHEASGEALPVEFFKPYAVKLGSDGKNAFRFSLQGDSDVSFFLSNRMQARLFLEEEGKAPQFVELIKPNPQAFSFEETEEAESSHADEEDEYASDESEDADASERRRSPPSPQHAEPLGMVLSLKPGRYLLVAEHSLGDVAVDWNLWLGSSVLLPGMKKKVALPAHIPVGLSETGLLSVRADSAVRSRCQLTDAQGKRVVEIHPSLPDWNCAFTHKLDKGLYALHIENPNRLAGEAELKLDVLPVSTQRALEGKQEVFLEQNAAELVFPQAEEGRVWRVEISGDTLFSCALESAGGERLFQQHQTHQCNMLLRPKAQTFQLQLWSQMPSAKLRAKLLPLDIAWGKKAQDRKHAVGFHLERSGSYLTAEGALCLEGEAVGIFRSCGPLASLEEGKWLFAHEEDRDISLKMKEEIQKEAFASATLELNLAPHLRRLQSSKPSMFLLWGKTQNQTLPPLCTLEGTQSLSRRKKGRCYAAGLGTQALAKLSSPLAPALSARVQWGFVEMPSRAEPLPSGKSQRSFSSGVGLFALPSEKTNTVDMVLAPHSWAMLLNEAQQVVDMCRSEHLFQACFLKGNANRLLLVSLAAKAELAVGHMDEADSPFVLEGLFEALPGFAGKTKLQIKASPQLRHWAATGALSCVLMLDNGDRQTECRGQIAPHVQGELSLKHAAGPLRAVVFESDEGRAAFGSFAPLSSPATLPANVRERLPAQGMSRPVVLEEDAAVYLTANEGTCALLQGETLLATEGMGQGCRLLRWLKAGRYHWEVRPFANQRLQGFAVWTKEKLSKLKEGMGEETWLLPQASKLFGFEMEKEAHWGLGLQAATEAFECKLLNEAQQLLGEGCQQYKQLPPGKYWLAIYNIWENQPARFRPVMFGMEAAPNEVPEEYLRELFSRAGESP